MKNKIQGEAFLQEPSETVIDFETRNAEIKALAAMVRTARDDALGLDLTFEAYLLDMAVVALHEQLEKQVTGTD